MAKSDHLTTNKLHAFELYVNAVSFHTTSQLINDQPLKELLFWPMVVNEAFALELFIKCLHAVRGNIARGHDLHSLFMQLKANDRDTITLYLAEVLAGHPFIPWAKSHGMAMDIDSILLRSKDSFTRLRYWHEGIKPNADASGHVSNAGAGAVSDAIRRLLGEIHPAWEAERLRLLTIPVVQSAPMWPGI